MTHDSIGLADGNPTLYGYVGDTNWWIDPFGLFRFPRWRRGNPIDQIMPDGSNPSWNTVRGRYWSNRSTALENNSSLGEGLSFDVNRENMNCMNRRTAPLDRSGNSMELHHDIPRRTGDPNVNNPGNLREVTREQHAELDSHRNLGDDNSNGLCR